MNSVKDLRKGNHLLIQALKILADTNEFPKDTELLIFGAESPIDTLDYGFKTNFLGYFNDDLSLALLYSATDVFVAPSMQDNLPNTLVEAACCGTPCVAFNVGGISEIIKHGVNGILAKPFDVRELANGINFIIKNPITREIVRENALSKFTQANTAAAYKQIYENVVEKKKLEVNSNQKSFKN